MCLLGPALPLPVLFPPQARSGQAAEPRSPPGLPVSTSVNPGALPALPSVGLNFPWSTGKEQSPPRRSG